MRPLIGMAAMVAVAAGLATVVRAQDSAPAGPRIALSQDVWDFGERWQDEKAQMTLTIKNEGTAPLIINDVRTTCGCTAAQPSRKEIPAGQTAELRVEYDTKGKQGDQSSKVLIFTNDPRQLGKDQDQKPGEMRLHVKGVVKRAVMKTPLGGLVIRTIDPKPGQTGTVRLENQMPEAMTLKLVTNELPMLDIDVKEVTPGRVYDVIGRTNREMKPGLLRGKVHFSTGLAKEPMYQVDTRIEIKRMVEPIPAAILLEKSNERIQRIIDLQYYGANGPEGFKVTSVDCPNKDIKVNVGNTLPAEPWMKTIAPPITAHLQVQVTLPGGNTLPAEGVLITFNTSVSECPKIDVIVTTDKSVFEQRMYGPEARPEPNKQ